MLAYFLALCFAWLAVGDGVYTVYGNGCVYVATGNKMMSRYDSQHLKAPFVNCSHLGLNSISYAGFESGIQSLGLARNNLTTFNASGIIGFSNLTFIDLGHNRISSVTAVNATHPGVHTINFGFNLLRKVPTALFTSYKSLHYLNLFNNSISSIQDGDFDDAASLQHLELGGNPIKQISDGAFLSMKDRLVFLDLSQCGLTSIPTSAGQMHALAMLNLGHNSISSLDANSFVNNTALRWVSLGSNKLHTIHPRAFEGATKLIGIELYDNKIESLPEGIFNEMADENSGMSVQLLENPIRCDCKLGWLRSWLDNLEIRDDISLKCAQPARNRGKTFYELTASDLTCDSNDKDWSEANHTACDATPTTVTLTDDSEDSTLCPKNCECYHKNGTKYQSISSPNFVSPRKRRWWHRHQYPFVDCLQAGWTKIPDGIRPDVKYLRLQGNNIESLSVQSFAQFTSMETLDVEGCSLKTFTAHPTTQLPHLTELDLQNNDLTQFTKNHLKSFPNLNTLLINHNNLQTIPKDLFVNNRRFLRLSLGPNPITSFNAQCLDGLNVAMLILRGMKLKTIPKITDPKLSYFALSDNVITSIPNGTFSGLPAVARIDLANNQIVKVEPEAFKGCKELRQIDLVENNITTFRPGVFDDMPRDKLRIELWRNRIYCDCNMRWFKQWIEELEDDDPGSEVRFSCLKPWRIHAKVSDTLRPKDFVCQTEDPRPNHKKDIETVDEEYYEYTHGACFTGGQIALTVFLTIFLTILSAFLIRWLCQYRDRKNRYRRPDDTARLDLDM